MSQSLEWYCEEVLILLMKTDPDLFPIDMVHHGPGVASALDKFVVKAVRGSRRLDGVGGYDVTVEVSFASGSKTPAELDEIADSVIEAVYENAVAGDVIGASGIPFQFLSIEEEFSSVRDDGKKTRKRTVTVPMIADDGIEAPVEVYTGEAPNIFIGEHTT